MDPPQLVAPPSKAKVFLLLFLQKKKNPFCSFLKKRTKRLLSPIERLNIWAFAD